MSDPNQNMLLDALRRVGVKIPEPNDLVSVRSIHVVEERSYWHVTCGAFDTFVDYRDATEQQNALAVAVDALHPWYIRGESKDWILQGGSVERITTVVKANRDAYLEWLHRGVK